MKQIFAVILAGAFLLTFCGSVFAGGVGNCVQPVKTTTKYLGVGAGVGYNYVNQRLNKLDNDRGANNMVLTDMNQIYGKGIIGLGDYVNIYGKIGGSNYNLKFDAGPQQAKMVIDLEDGLYTGAGLNALFPIGKCHDFSFGVGFDVQANFFLNEVKGITREEVTASNVDGSFYGLDGQNSVYLTCRYDIKGIKASIIPYVGAYHSWAVVGTLERLTYYTYRNAFNDYNDKHFQAAFDFQSVGPLFGIDVDVAEFVNLNVEGRLVGETALTAGATVKF